ncbi:conserved hypothetical protein [Flavobacterium sp. 9AF]|uniref:hypothetical protein n=1 Tax=Flavobacterium sp. 9AF TaxID=2653142 RepID=UPI0012F3ECCF|nr:hypothetical protein [Flavobacterium sp. 9AF]VXC22924.1 conserved hypothetical protein [Flavobacterium sp. 9AF]
MEYLVTTEGFKKYNLILNNSILAKMNYIGWLNSTHPSFDINNKKNYLLDKPSMWKSNFKIVSFNQVILEFNFRWNGNITIKWNDNNHVKIVTLRLQSIWKSNYVLYNETGNEILIIKCKYDWKTWKSNYTITESTNLISNHKEVLYLSLIHCIITLKNMAAAASA